jgi:hypothetical protein
MDDRQLIYIFLKASEWSIGSLYPTPPVLVIWASRCFTGWGRNGPGRRPVTQSGLLATKCSRRSHCCCLFLCSWSFASFRFRQLLFVFLLRLIQSLACFCFLFRHQEQETTASLNPGIVSIVSEVKCRGKTSTKNRVQKQALSPSLALVNPL